MKFPSRDELIFEKEIRFENVEFTYEGKEHPALQNISFTIKKGTNFAILGTTGSGKSTLIQLLLRLVDPSKGNIFVDDLNLKELDLNKWKKNIGYVPQDVFLFSDTIQNNIAFGLSESTEQLAEKVLEASKMAAFHGNISGFPEGYETKVGERGITLSGGQKQRVAIARAFIKDPLILLMDDCLSALDTKTESEILDNLNKIKKGKTTIIVSHRVSSVKDADQILVLDEGKIIEFGTHLSLLDLNGSYCDIYNKQILDQALND
jgi:ATP-binding cassette subfamily B protein